MTSFNANFINFPALLPQSRDSSYTVSDAKCPPLPPPQTTPLETWDSYCAGIQHTISIYPVTYRLFDLESVSKTLTPARSDYRTHWSTRTLLSCDTSLGSLTGFMPEARDFVESLRLYSYRYSNTLSKTSALDRRGRSTLRPGRFNLRKENRYPLYRRLGRHQGRFERVRKISPPAGIRSPDRPAHNELLRIIRYPEPQC